MPYTPFGYAGNTIVSTTATTQWFYVQGTLVTQTVTSNYNYQQTYNDYQSYQFQPGQLIEGEPPTTPAFVPCPELDEAELQAIYAAQQASIRTMEARMAEEAQGRAEAIVRAEALLLEHLTPEQRESWTASGSFLVETNARVYELHRDTNTRRLASVQDRRPLFSYCIHTPGVPRADELLGFKLLLEANEGEFLRTANATALARP
jgi:hypothetical protein